MGKTEAEARKFCENAGVKLDSMVNRNGKILLWIDMVNWDIKLYFGSWLIRDEAGEYSVMSDAEFREEYDESKGVG
jgi:hypothetical protein